MVAEGATIITQKNNEAFLESTQYSENTAERHARHQSQESQN